MVSQDEFAAYYTARAAQVRSTAYPLCGDWHLAEDLTQTAFTKLYRAWSRIDRHEVLDQYTWRVILRSPESGCGFSPVRAEP